MPEAEVRKFLDELVNSNLIRKNFDDIANYRKLNNLPVFSKTLKETGTVAKIEINGKGFYGINSRLSPSSLSLRKKWFNSIENWIPPKNKVPNNISRAQSFLHAEAHSLINAFEELGRLENKIVLYVDRQTCNMCVGELPILMKKMKVEELTIINNIEQTKKVVIKIINNEIQVYRF